MPETMDIPIYKLNTDFTYRSCNKLYIPSQGHFQKSPAMPFSVVSDLLLYGLIFVRLFAGDGHCARCQGFLQNQKRHPYGCPIWIETNTPISERSVILYHPSAPYSIFSAGSIDLMNQLCRRVDQITHVLAVSLRPLLSHHA